MKPGEWHDGWLSASGGRRRPVRAAALIPAASEATPGDGPREKPATPPSGGESPSLGAAPANEPGRGIRLRRRDPLRRGDEPSEATAKSLTRPIDWLEVLRGMVVVGIWSTVLWLEWLAIKALATYLAG